MILVLGSYAMPQLQGRDMDLDARQASHTRPTPRLGGIAFFSATCAGIGFVPATISEPYAQFVLATSLLFAVTLLEDLGYAVSPRIRLLIAMLAALLVIVLLEVWLTRIGIAFIDPALNLWFFGVPLTLIATAGVANAFNLIDGVNGLAVLTAGSAALALFAIADAAAFHDMSQLTLLFLAALAGFAVLNFPFGLIFLGDAGAYTLGFILSWFGISMVLNIEELTPWAILLVMFWPVAETVFSMYRRSRRRTGTMQPDRIHMHQLVMRGLEVCLIGREKCLLANSMTTVVMAPFVILPPIVGVLFWNEPKLAFAAVVVLSTLFVSAYALGPAAVKRFRRRLKTKPSALSRCAPDV